MVQGPIDGLLGLVLKKSEKSITQSSPFVVIVSCILKNLFSNVRKYTVSKRIKLESPGCSGFKGY